VSDERRFERALVVVAHPDDVDFGAAGTVATWTAAGVEVTYCLVTSGDAGGSDRNQSYAERAELREEEQRQAAAAVGVSDLRFLRHPDGKVVADLDLRRDISRVIRQVRPDVVLCQSAARDLDRIYASHPDHLAAGEAAMCAVYPDARNPFAHPELLDIEGLEPWTVPEVWVMASPHVPEHARVVVDVTDVIDRKVEALRCHLSQTAHREDLDDMIRQWAAGTAAAVGLPEGRLAESFRRVDTR